VSHPDPSTSVAPSVYEPRRPTLIATGVFTLWIAILSLPMLRGQWLAGPFSDQVTAGLPFRGWGAEWWRRLGHVPLWNPEIFGGMPYVGALGTGDILYPTAFLRLVLPTATVMNIGFFVHYILAGVFMYLLLRRLPVAWSGAVVGGVAYQLSGLVASYAQPGHDGKLVVTALLPLVLLGLIVGMRDRRLWGYGVTALGIGLSILSQHVQMTYYMLVAAGLFALYLCFGTGTATTSDRIRVLGLASVAIALGFGIAAIQLLPAFEHMPLSARAVSVQGGFAGSTTYGIPWVHIPEFFLKNFVGWGHPGTYWGPNGLKLHSEYLGLPVIALALLGAGAGKDARLRLWLAGIGLLFLLIGLGKGTPFYHLWWSVMPYVKQMRAPGMAYFVVVFVVACFAAFGVERLEGRADGARCKSHVRAWLIAAGVLALLAVAGVFGNMAGALAQGRPVAGADIMFGAVTSAIALAAAAGLVWAGLGARLPSAQWMIALALVIGADLWLNARQFWTYSTLDRDLYRADAVTERIKATPSPAPARALDLGLLVGPGAVYPGAVLMAEDVPQLLGVHGFEIRYFVDLVGGRDEWRNLGNPHLWDLFAVRWVIVPAAAQGLDSIPGFTRVLRDAATPTGAAHLFERTAPAPYARVVPAAFKLDSATIIPTLLDPRMDYSRIVLFATDQPVTPAPMKELPPPSTSRATVTSWQPGRMTVTLDPAPPQPSYLLVAENWYPDWQVAIDGHAGQLLRGDYSLITVPLPAGARTVDLTFHSRLYEIGKAITLASLALLLIALVASLVGRRARHA